jgi:hypothetical protein
MQSHVTTFLLGMDDPVAGRELTKGQGFLPRERKQRSCRLLLITRHAGCGDARSNTLTLTRKGDRLLERTFTALGPERQRLMTDLGGL